MGDYYARFRGGRRVKLPPATRPDQLGARCVGAEVPPDQVGRGRRVAGHGGRRSERPRLARHQAQLAHDRPHELRAAPLALADQRGVDAAMPVCSVRVVVDPVRAENLVTIAEQHFPGSRPRHRRPDQSQQDRLPWPSDSST